MHDLGRKHNPEWKRGHSFRMQVKSEVGRHGLRRNDVLAVVTHDELLRYRVRNCKVVLRYTSYRRDIYEVHD